ncbi:MAG: Cna B-type domain-containing protein [Erysipelotrichaceae bacterium]|nr:Cna B-type domain-containing protein [Erysipelotrichaceae bacterium]
MRQITKKVLKSLLSVIMCISILQILNLGTRVHAASGDVPDHDKTLTVNEDGTYTIALNVTGDSEKQIQKVNVIVIVDRSGSMGSQSGTGAYVPSSQNGTNMYGLVDGEYVGLTRTDNGYWANPRYTYTVTSTGESYTGQRYQYDGTATRLEATKAAVASLADTLLGYNGKDGNPADTVEMALVSFATSSTTNVSSTTDVDTYVDAVNGLTVATGQNAGTNWESALQRAKGITFGNDGDPTYVIFFSDGAPTFYLNAQGGTAGSGYEQEPNMEDSYNAATDDAAALAQQVGVKNFYTIFAYGSDAGKTYMTNLTSEAGAPAENNYSASNTAELNDAFAAILESIEMAGIGAVSMEDGTTSSVTTTTGEISNLLTVDTNSFKYYRAGGTENGSEKYDSDANGGLGEEWTDAPEASFEGGAVKWDLTSEGVLENEVTYTVTFNCWPSQTTLDIVADIKNDPSSYDTLDANIKKYIDEEGNLKTNTSASLSYTDTRTGENSTEEFENPDPVATSAVEDLAITKEWSNAFEDKDKEPITLNVTRDNENTYTMLLNEGNNWKASVYISIGILRHTNGDEYEILEKGHDFTFTEPKDLGYYWEIEVPVVRPMMVDGELTMLIKKDEKHTNPDDAAEYTIDGNVYYVGSTGDAKLTATNHRRSRLNITKVVDGEDADPDQTFPFTLNVVDSKASEGSADNLNSDYWVWFSVWNGGYVDCLVSGAEKEMKDGAWTGYYYAPSGQDVVVNLKSGDNLRFLNLPTDSTYTITEGTLPANYTFTSSVLSGGADESFSGAQTSTGTIVETETDYVVTYTNTYGLTDIEITKEWEDNDDQDGIRPTADEFKSMLTLKADGTDVTSANASKLAVTDNGDGTYTVKWTGLDRYSNGEDITYTVEEAAITGYTTTGSPAEDHGTITNTHTPETIDITVTKQWDDKSNQDGIRPASVKFQLYANGTAVAGQTVTLSKPEGATVNEWTATFEDVAKYAGGEEIVYTIKELKGNTALESGEKLDDNYTVTYPANLTAKNSYSPATTSVKVTKSWSDANNQDGIRPTSVKVQLMVGTENQGDPVELSETNSWTYTWTGLDKNKDGVAIAYTVTEVTDSVITGTDGPGTYKFEVTGSQANGYVVTNTHTPEVTERTVKKEWSDVNNQDGIRPGSVTMLLKNGDKTVATVTLPTEDGKWEATVDKLPKYAGTTTEINYTWVESPVPTGYEDTYAVSDNTTTVTNTHIPEVTTVTVTKVWDDNENQDGIRPETVQIKLLADGKDYTGENATVTLPIDGKLTYTWEDLPEYTGSTTPVAYTVEEVKTAVITGTDGPGTYKFEVTGTQADGYKVTNTHTPETTEIEVKKVWSDASNQDGKRPDSVTYQIYAGTVKVEGTLATVTLSGNGDTWTAKVSGLPKYAGTTTPIDYSVKELNGTTELADGGTLPGKDGAEYTVAYTDKLIVTNSYTPEETERTVVKKWDDNDNQDGFRPESLTVDLYADGTKVGSVTLNASNSWTDTISKLPVYNNGTKITYSWVEQLPADVDYSKSGEVVEGTKTTITNKHTPDQTSVSVEKIWDDADDQDGLRPTSVTVQLMVGEDNIGDAVVLSAENEWKYTWTELDKRADGEIIQYTVKEVEVPKGYEVAIENKGAEGSFDYKVTNKHTPEKTTFTATKVWADDDDRDGVRPDSITAVLLKDGKEFDTQVLDESNEWTYTWTGLDKYKNHGTLISYTVEEKVVPTGYEVSVNGGTITNTHTPELTTVPVEKKWDDADNQDGIRPDSITVSLKADGTEVQTATLNEANGWKYTFESTENAPLYKYKAVKQPITYTVEETSVPKDYTMTQEGNVITNKHVPEVIELTVKKEWKDNDNNDGKRPTSITVTLKSDGTAIKQLTLNEDNKWTETVTGLPKNKAGKEIVYTFEEMEVTDYTAEYSDIVDGVITITNTHEDELINITVVKEWVGDEGYDVRPEELNIVLSAKQGDIANLSQTVSEETGWKTEFKNLNKYYKGEEIEYSADEDEIPTGYKKTLTTVEKNKQYKITNEFKPISYDPPVKKEVTGDVEKANKSDTFTFKFEAVTEGAPMPDGSTDGVKTVTIKAGEEYEFGNMYLTKPGTYEYKITEVDEGTPGYKYSDKEYKLVFTIGTEGTEDSEQLTCKLTVNGEEVDHTAQDAYTFEFFNEYREFVDVEVEKIWVDNNDAEGIRPEEIEVTLYANNKAVETVKLNKGNNWKYTWEDQPYSDENFKEIKYTVKEDNVPEGYKMTSAQSENKVTITNTMKTPETGDANNMALWLSLFGVSMSGTLAAAYVSLKKKKEEE